MILVASVAAVCSFVALSATTTEERMRDPERPSRTLRGEHVEMRGKLARVGESIGMLSSFDSPGRRAAMNNIVNSSRREIRPHGEWEERALYPMADRFRPCDAEPFTASMRYEHRIVTAWIEDLAGEAEASVPDSGAFVRGADRLLGLVLAHMEVEEAALLSILDERMTPEEFEAEIGTCAEYR